MMEIWIRITLLTAVIFFLAAILGIGPHSLDAAQVSRGGQRQAENCTFSVEAVNVEMPDTAGVKIRNEGCAASAVSSLKIHFTIINTTGDLVASWPLGNAVRILPPQPDSTSQWITKKFRTSGGGTFRLRVRISECNDSECPSIGVELSPAFRDSGLHKASP